MSYIYFDHTQITYQGIVSESKENYFILTSKLEPLYVYSKNNPYEVGDILEIKGNKTKITKVSKLRASKKTR